VFLFNGVVFTFSQPKELNEVVLRNWLRTGVGGGRPFPSRLPELDDVGVCHILSIFTFNYIDTAIAPELGYNQLIRHKKSNCQSVLRQLSQSQTLCVQKLLCSKNKSPPLWFVIFTETPPFSWRDERSGVYPD
jgi:hypothetical protein